MPRGFEPDEGVYIQHAELVRGKKQIDLAQDPSQDPPPDLIIEIDITGPSLNKFPADSDYIERAESAVLPKVMSAILSELIDASR